MTKMPKENIKDRLEGNELDLSLSSLTVVPVKDLAPLTMATNLDLSCNFLVTLPDSFCTLKHVVSLNLSKNQLTSLPSNFGALSKLQNLDLVKNKLEKLPVSFCHLKNLRRLDVKDNPLDPHLQKVAGDCLDDSQCKRCAQRIVSFMKEVESEQERQKQKRLKIDREKEAVRKEEEAMERQRKKEEKNADKERRRQEYLVKQAELKKQKEAELQAQKKGKEKTSSNGVGDHIDVSETKSSGFSVCFGVILPCLVLLLAVSVGFYFYCQQNEKIPICIDAQIRIQKFESDAQFYYRKWMSGEKW
ncbi:leucine-rich repeat-containing protein 59-like [Lineus longissimus]|uniref:leucine-rich repeat-containing protein 59-like n=1 Tax=Lineus longissimus TaxID=88925 RepID=UPI002B4FB486